MTRSEIVEIELDTNEFRALKANRTISDMCGKYLTLKERRGGFVVLNMTKREAEFLRGLVASEANHSRSDVQSELLNSACDSIELCI